MDSWMDIGTDGMYTVMADPDDGYYLRATAMYTDGEGRHGTREQRWETQTMMVTIQMTVDPCSTVVETDTREVAENTAAGADIGAYMVTAMDADGDTLAYYLGRHGRRPASDIDLGHRPVDDQGRPWTTEGQLRGHGHGHRPRQSKRHDHGDHHR